MTCFNSAIPSPSRSERIQHSTTVIDILASSSSSSELIQLSCPADCLRAYDSSDHSESLNEASSPISDRSPLKSGQLIRISDLVMSVTKPTNLASVTDSAPLSIKNDSGGILVILTPDLSILRLSLTSS